MHESFESRLREVVPPVGQQELRQDLWPRMAERLEKRPFASVPWWDWVLAGAAVAGFVVFPDAIPWALWQC